MKIAAYVTQEQLRKAMEDAIFHLGDEMATNLFGERALCEMIPPKVRGLELPQEVLPMEAGDRLSISVNIEFQAMITIQDLDDDITQLLNSLDEDDS